ncbi:YgfZ/GcvT domain-containing protein [Coraliomargarita akajimensis]|uniref:Folate-binding protein YgfZ n=1 Tax=Coraliomargarita akajimensis (strain DSM 45221 / IAM 15411 / JCM 23193 / KCTC 12865 / 04OKA010-24) TaxID=583355 RepID=D5EQK6_CORAD|nr:folate-binding protein YgfZ [Coraliomargarita akajimensis]ADE55820.1 folate-binding protein YgfZ [Coraliomargarita akajimensis DSM 45221]
MSAVYAYQFTPAALIHASDEDAADFLQSQFSNELRPFAEGRCTYGLWLDVKGKVIADSFILQCDEESFLLYSATSSAEGLQAKLEQHIIADDVELEISEGARVISLFGPGVESALTEWGASVPQTGDFVEHAGVRLLPVWNGPRPRVDCIVRDAAALDTVVDALKRLSVEFVDTNRFELERVEQGYPVVPQELGEGDLPGEGGAENYALSFTKGCFLGQEVVARMHNLGTPRRALYRVSGVGDPPAVPQALQTMEGKTAGELRSAFVTADGWLGVAMLKLSAVGAPIHLQGEALTLLSPLKAGGVNE